MMVDSQVKANDVPSGPRWLAFWPWLIVLVGAIVIILTYRHYGITWDEGGQAYYGQLALERLRTGTNDANAEHFLSLGFTYYGPLLEMIPCLLHGPDETGLYDIRHLFFGLLALLVVPALAIFARRSQLTWSALFASIALLTMPSYFGQWTNNSKDVPFATAVVWFMASIALLASTPALTWKRVLITALALGLALCARPGGLMLLGLFVIGALVLGGRTRQGPDVFERGWRGAAASALKIATLFVIAWIIMILPWPWAHTHPLSHPIEAMSYSINFRRNIPVMFKGQQISSLTLPWHYLLTLITLTTPPVVLLLALVGIGFSIWWLARQFESRRALFAALTLMWLFVPIALFIVQRPAIYDGMRHFLFLLPAVAILAGLGAAGAIEQLRSAKARTAAAVVACAILLLPIKDCVRLHPYEMTYFNGLAGGLHGADGRYDMDYWAASYGEAMAWVNQQAARDPQRRIRVLVGGPEYIFPCAGNHKAANVDVIMLENPPSNRELPAGIDYYIATTRFHYANAFPDAPVVDVIGRDGAVFTQIKAHGAKG